MNKKPIIFSGIQPSGQLHLGNYVGAISQWVELQKKYNCIFCVVDYHAITVKQNPKELNQRIIDIAKTYLAAGIDPAKSIIFQQSTISAHTELAWLLNCTSSRISDLNKMTQFKDKAGSKQENVSVGLYDYPVLMAADILLYQTDVVPVGDDQSQHVELARTIARRFNHSFSSAFKVPELLLRQQGARIMGLDDASKKMSKSSTNSNNYIALADSIEIAKKKIMKAQTDSGQEIKYDIQKKPAISNLLTIYSILSGETIKNLEKKYSHKNYGEFKKDLASITADWLENFQKKYNHISDSQVKDILETGRKKIEPIAQKTLKTAKRAVGLIV